jgi:phage terminase Nu1 subunit (DNA packaging protein)
MAIKFSQLDASATQAGFSELVGIKRQTVADWLEKGLLEKGGTYRDWLLAYCERLRTQAAGRGMSGSGDYETEKLRLTKAQADNEEQKAEKSRLEVEAMRARLLDADRVLQMWTGMTAAMRARMLAIPSKGASLVMAADSQVEREGILRSLVYEALSELAEREAMDYVNGTLFESSESLDVDPEAAPEFDGDGVGGHDAPPKPRRQRRARAVQ